MKNRRKLSRRLLKLLPESLRYGVLRRHVPVCREFPEQLEIKVADCMEELSVAYRLLHDSYVNSGFMSPHPSGMRILPQHLLPQASTIVAKWEGQVIGTLSLIRDNPFSLPMERLFDLSPRRSDGKRLAEVSSLAVDPQFRGKVDQALFPLFRFVYHYAKTAFGTHEFVIAVNPSMEDLYRAFLLFERLTAAPKTYDFVNGAPAVGLYLDFAGLEDRWSQVFQHRPEHVQWFTELPNQQRNCLPRRDYYSSSDPVLTPELLEGFYLRQAGVGTHLTIQQLQILSDAWPGPGFHEVFDRLPEICRTFNRREIRIDVQMPARSLHDPLRGEVLNLSLKGLQLRTSRELAHDQVVELQVEINSTTSVNIKAMVRWAAQGIYGMELLECSTDWIRLVSALKQKFDSLDGQSAASARKLAA